MTPLIKRLFALSPDIRYVATYLNGIHHSSQRPGITEPSSSESDKYEELIVNPTLLKLVTQRGNIDCGGAHWVLIRYGQFYELVIPIPEGHVSIGAELTTNPVPLVEAALGLLATPY